MDPRKPEEAHRVSTPLELFVDLAFVVAVAQASSSFHHGLVNGNLSATFTGFPLVFFAIWWAWMNFTWFASAYDNDDVFYRLATFVQMAGVLVLAAGVPRAFHHSDIAVVTYGYVIMRLAMVSQWLRAAASDPSGRSPALRYAAGISIVQFGWLLRLVLPEKWAVPSIIVLIACELWVPYWAESAGRTAWHPRHIADRYGGFTIIVLGESVLSATVGVQAALDAHSAALTGAGVAVALDQASGQSRLTDIQAGLSTTAPIAVYLAVVWSLHRAQQPRGLFNSTGVPIASALVVAAAFSPEPLLFAGVIVAGLIAASLAMAPTEAPFIEPSS